MAVLFHLAAGAATAEIGITGLGLAWDAGGNDHEMVGSSTNTLVNTGLITATGSGLHNIQGVDNAGMTFRNSGTFVHAFAERLRLGNAGKENMTFENDGTFQYAVASSRVYGHPGARFDNLPDGVMEVSAAGSHNFEVSATSGQVFRNKLRRGTGDGRERPQQLEPDPGVPAHRDQC